MTETATPSTHWRPPPQGAWTWDDYARMPPTEGRRYEVIEGELFMSPSPRPRHQIVAMRLLNSLYGHLEPRGGMVLPAPCDVRLDEGAGVVQPDIVVIRREHLSIVRENYVLGVPDLLVEILSPSNPQHDLRRKWDLYLAHRVPEYWIADPDDGWLEAWTLRGDAYVPLGRFTRGQVLEADTFAGLRVAADTIFAP